MFRSDLRSYWPVTERPQSRLLAEQKKKLSAEFLSLFSPSCSATVHIYLRLETRSASSRRCGLDVKTPGRSALGKKKTKKRLKGKFFVLQQIKFHIYLVSECLLWLSKFVITVPPRHF